jgi:PhnB protein
MSESPKSPAGGVTPHISVDGASAASAFYQQAFGAEELFRLPAQDGKRLMHCHLKINGGSLMLADCFPEHGGSMVQRSDSFTMHLQVEDVEAWWRRAVEAGATVTMPLADMFWGDRYGRLCDPFGVNWSLAAPVKAG